MSVPAKSKPPPETALAAQGPIKRITVASIQLGMSMKASLRTNRELSFSNFLREGYSNLGTIGVRTHVTWRFFGSSLVDNGQLDFGLVRVNESTGRQIQ
jgi:hypothetical protein